MGRRLLFILISACTAAGLYGQTAFTPETVPNVQLQDARRFAMTV